MKYYNLFDFLLRSLINKKLYSDNQAKKQSLYFHKKLCFLAWSLINKKHNFLSFNLVGKNYVMYNFYLKAKGF